MIFLNVISAYNGHTDMCSLLLDQGAEVDKETTKDYFTALMLATLAGISTFSNIIIIQYFVESNIIS